MTQTKEEKAAFTKNGNKFVSDNHYFAYGEGCYFPTLEIAEKNFSSYNKVGVHYVTKDFEGKAWYQFRATNAWD